MNSQQVRMQYVLCSRRSQICCRHNILNKDKEKLGKSRSESSDLLFSFCFYFLQELSNPVLVGNCQCYFKNIEMFESCFCVKLQFKDFNSLEQQQQCAKSTGFDHSCKKQKKNEYNRSEFLDQNLDQFGLQTRLKLVFQIYYTQPRFL